MNKQDFTVFVSMIRQKHASRTRLKLFYYFITSNACLLTYFAVGMSYLFANPVYPYGKNDKTTNFFTNV